MSAPSLHGKRAKRVFGNTSRFLPWLIGWRHSLNSPGFSGNTFECTLSITIFYERTTVLNDSSTLLFTFSNGRIQDNYIFIFRYPLNIVYKCSVERCLIFNSLSNEATFVHIYVNFLSSIFNPILMAASFVGWVLPGGVLELAFYIGGFFI